MKMKNLKSFISDLFSSKSHSNCCNIQFEEVVNENDLIKEQTKDSFEIKNNDNKSSSDKNESNNTCDCGCC